MILVSKQKHELKNNNKMESMKEILSNKINLIKSLTFNPNIIKICDEILNINNIESNEPINKNVEDVVGAINKRNMPKYHKVELILNALKDIGSEYSISIIPDGLFNIFWSFAENKNTKIEFIDEDYQIFTIGKTKQ